MSDQVAITGPVGYREFVLDKACQSRQGHTHHYDHAMLVFRGVLLVEAFDTNDEVVSRGRYSAGQWVDIPANLKHRVTAEADGTVYFCIFSHRDFEGMIAHCFTGNEEAYT